LRAELHDTIAGFPKDATDLAVDSGSCAPRLVGGVRCDLGLGRAHGLLGRLGLLLREFDSQLALLVRLLRPLPLVDDPVVVEDPGIVERAVREDERVFYFGKPLALALDSGQRWDPWR
jgi:hypothetical protein